MKVITLSTRPAPAASLRARPTTQTPPHRTGDADRVFQDISNDDCRHWKYRCANKSLSVPPSEHRPTVPYQCPNQTRNQSNLTGTLARNSMGTFEHITFVQPRRLRQPGSSPGRDSNEHLNTLSTHVQLGTETGVNWTRITNGGSMSSSSADVLKPQSGGEAVSLAFLDLHNYGSFSGHQGMGVSP